MASRHKKTNGKPKKEDFVLTRLEVISRKEHAEIDLKTFNDMAGGVGLYTMTCGNRPITKEEFRELISQVPEDVITPEEDNR